MREPFEWMAQRRYDPQGRIEELFAELGHERAQWQYMGDERTAGGIYRMEGTRCQVCGSWAMYGAVARPGGRRGRQLCIWGPALEEECVRGPKLVAAIPILPTIAPPPEDPELVAAGEDDAAPGEA